MTALLELFFDFLFGLFDGTFVSLGEWVLSPFRGRRRGAEKPRGLAALGLGCVGLLAFLALIVGLVWLLR